MNLRSPGDPNPSILPLGVNETLKHLISGDGNTGQCSGIGRSHRGHQRNIPALRHPDHPLRHRRSRRIARHTGLRVTAGEHAPLLLWRPALQLRDTRRGSRARRLGMDGNLTEQSSHDSHNRDNSQRLNYEKGVFFHQPIVH